MVKIMRTDRIVVIITLVSIISLSIVSSIRAQSADELKTFYSTNYPGIALKVDATNETDPGKNVTLKLLADRTSSDVFYVECFNMTVYGFKLGGPEEAVLYSALLVSNVSLTSNQTINQTHTIPVPSDVYGPVFCRLYFKYVTADESVLRNPDFAITSVRNIDYENLKDAFQHLNETYWHLNQTYWELQENYTDLQKSMTDLSNTRILATVFLVTTVFFVATTLYLTLRKPRESW